MGKRESAEATPLLPSTRQAVISPLTGPVRQAAMKAPKIEPAEVSRALHQLHVLLRTHRLYEKNHPSILENLDTTYDLLRGIAAELNGLEVRVERGGLVVPKLGDAHLADPRGELHALATDLQRSGVRSLIFAKKFNVGELDTLANL